MYVLVKHIMSKSSEPPGTMRHLGWDDTSASGISDETDCNGIT